MKYLSSFVIVLVVLFMVGCGGGSGSGHNGGGGGNGGGAVIDPSGNWEMIATDGQNSVHLAAMFNQTGTVVTSNSFTAAGNPPPFNCIPFHADLANGTVNGANFTGNVTVHYDVNFPIDLTPTQSTFTFNTTVAADEQTFSGTYASMPACSGVASTGTFTGTSIPSTSGSWTGSVAPCIFNGQTGICTNTALPTAFTASLTQDDGTGNVTGSYSATAIPGFAGGTVAVNAPAGDILSGRTWQFTLTETGGLSKFVASGQLDTSRNFTGVIVGTTGPDSGQHFNLSITH